VHAAEGANELARLVRPYIYTTKENMILKKEQRQMEFRRRVFELAATGKYSDHQGIEAALASDFPEAREWLDRDSFRDDVRNACAVAKTAQR
jgi:hypothetical protein